jgi:3-hydroxyisobutyrate dehydrogenase-like beta-hydroxyacid dehydrogenase
MAQRQLTAGVIGLGIIGSRVAAQLRNAGFEVWVWNRSPKQEPNFLGSAKQVAESAETIQIFVSDGPALMANIEAMKPALTARHVILNHATVAPTEVKAAAEIVTKCGAGFLDAPFTGSKLAAETGKLVYYLGGDASLQERVRPVLNASSKEILSVGSIGQASLVKIATNLVTAATVQVLSEALALLDKADVPLETFIKAIELNAVNSVTAQLKMPLMLTGEFKPHFALKHMLKDVNLGLSEAKACNISLPATHAVAESMRQAVASGWGDLDLAAVSKNYAFSGKVKSAKIPSVDPDRDDAAATAQPRKSIFPLFGKRA